MTDSAHSFKDYTGRSLADRPATEFSGKTVRGMCLAQGRPDTAALPSGVTDCVLQDCQLDNVLIPSGYSIVRGSARRILPFNGVDMLVDVNNQPIEPA